MNTPSPYMYPGPLSWIPISICVAGLALPLLGALWFHVVALYHRPFNTWDFAVAANRRAACLRFAVRVVVTLAMTLVVALPMRLALY